MNILIKNYTPNKNSSQLSVIIDLMNGQFKDKLLKKGRIRFDDERLENKLEIEIQPNGNYLIEYDMEAQNE